MRRTIGCACAVILAAAQMSSAAGENDDGIVALYTQGKFTECLAAIEPHRTPGPLNLKLLSASAHSKLSLGDAQGARQEYTKILAQEPLHADIWLARAKCEVAMGSLRDGEADVAIAKMVDAKAIEPFLDTYNTMLAAAKPLVVAEPIDALWQKYLSAARDMPDAELMNIATKIVRLRNASRYINDEEFTRVAAPLALQVHDKPADIDALLNYASFLVDPVVARPAMLEGKSLSANVKVRAPEGARAKGVLAAALKIDAGNTRAMGLMAQAFDATGPAEQATAWADKALNAGSLTLNVAMIRLDAYTNLADPMSNRAAQLRQPTVRMGDRMEGNRRVQYSYTEPPTPEAIAEAVALETKATALRQQAAAPLESIIEKTKSSSTPADALLYAMANARFSAWRGRYDDAIGWAQKAVAIDPFQPNMLDLLVEVGGNMHRNDVAIGADDRLNNAQNPSAGRTLDGVWPLMKEGKFDAARALIAQADKRDPGSIALACARFAMAQEQGNLPDAIYAARLTNALNLARATLDGRSLFPKPPAHATGDDVVLMAYTFTAIGRLMSDAGQIDGAINHFERAINACASVPEKQLATPVPETILPNDPGKAGGATYLKTLVAAAHRQAGELLVRQNKLKEAAAHLAAAGRMGDTTPQLPFMAYRCYKTAGPDAFNGPIPDAWREKFRIWDMQHADVSPAAAAQMDRTMLDLQIDQITRQIEQGVGPDDQRALEAKRAALIAKRGK